MSQRYLSQIPREDIVHLCSRMLYTIDGLWDVGVLLNEEKYLNSAKKALDGVLSIIDKKGLDVLI